MNKLDLDYQKLLETIITSGIKKSDRTGTGTMSIFGATIRHKMEDGFPLLTTKKMPLKTIAVELKWFLNGDTNIKYLVENNCNIWNGDAYKKYVNHTSKNTSEYNAWMRDNGDGTLSMFTMQEFIEKIKTDSLFAEMWGELGPIYGKQWRKWTVNDGTNGFDSDYVDQIENLIDDLKNNPDSRRLMVNAWNVAEIPKMTLPPCHYGFQCYTRELSYEERRYLAIKNNLASGGKLFFRDEESIKEMSEFLDAKDIPKRALSLSWNQRSVDTLLGLPFNIASYGLLLMLLAKEVNMMPDELIGNLGDTHLYLNHIEQANEQMGRIPYDLPTLTIKGSDFDIYNFPLESIELRDYVSHEKIDAPLSN